MVPRLLLWIAAACVVVIVATAHANATPTPKPSMVIEWLKFKVPPAQRQRYLTVDDEIWTSALATYPGFVDKTTWLDPGHDDEVIFVISWATREQWKAIPEADLVRINQRFDQALGFGYEMLESKEFVVPAASVGTETAAAAE